MLRHFAFASFLGFLAALFAFSEYMGLVPLRILGIKFYGADFILILLLLVFALYGFSGLISTRFSLFILFYIVFGLFSMFYGYLSGHDLNAAIGDFRRLFFYTVAFLVTWRIFDAPKRLSRPKKIAYFATVPVVLLSVTRAWKGVSWNVNYSGEDVRAVSYVAATVLLVVFYDSLSALLFTGRPRTTRRNLLWLLVVGFTFLISNYRLLWALPLAGGFGLLVIAWIKQRVRSLALVRILLTVAVIGILVVVILRTVQNKFYVSVEQKFVQKVLGFRFVNSFRYFVWGAAWRLFEDHWLVGVGLGHRLEYELLSSIGTWYTRVSTPHSIFLEMLYETGIVGTFLFSSLHISFLIYVWRQLRTLPVEWARSTLIWLFTYLSMFVFGLFQPFLTAPSVAVLFYIVMAITARQVYWGRRTLLCGELSVGNRPV